MKDKKITVDGVELIPVGRYCMRIVDWKIRKQCKTKCEIEEQMEAVK